MREELDQQLRGVCLAGEAGHMALGNSQVARSKCT